MTEENSGQSGREPGDDREVKLARNWDEIPARKLGKLLSGFCTSRRISFGAVAERTGLAKETVRKVAQRMSVPHDSTREVLGNMLLEAYPGGITVEGGVVEQPKDEKEWKLRERLIELLPKGEEAARHEIARLFELARRSSEAPEWLEKVEHWLDLQVRGEYWNEREWEPLRRREARGGKIKPEDEPKW